MDTETMFCVMCGGQPALKVQCGHHVCQGCVHALTNSGNNNQAIYPPCCHQESYAPYFVVPDFNEFNKCALHEDIDATQECLTCGVSHCSDCVLRHDIPAFAHHKLAEVGTLARRAKVRSVFGHHEKPSNSYCTSCKRLVCHHCDSSHREHACQPPSDDLETLLGKVDLNSFFSMSDTEVTRLCSLLTEAKEKVIAGEETALQLCHTALAALEARVKADTTAKLDGINKRLNALTALKRRLDRGKAMLAAAENHDEQFQTLDYAKKLAYSLSTISVPVPEPLVADKGNLEFPFAFSNEGTEANFDVSNPGTELLAHRPSKMWIFEKIPGPEYEFEKENHRIRRTSHPQTSWKFVKAAGGICVGQHVFALQVKSKKSYVLFGLRNRQSAPENDLSNDTLCKSGFFIFGSVNSGTVYGPGSINRPYSAAVFSNGECSLELQVDMEKRTLGFVVNGRNCGIAFSDLPDGPLYPAVHLAYLDESAEIPHTQSDPTSVPVENYIKSEILLAESEPVRADVK